MGFFGVIAFLELIGENSYALEQSGEKHYMRGGKPGFYPSLKKVVPHPVPFDLFDPFGLSAKATPEKKERGLLAEINNGRLAMLGLKPYSGEFMAPFSASNADLPYVSEMLGFTSL